jgi:predicted enzyme related to lactoylglutathione lyase
MAAPDTNPLVHLELHTGNLAWACDFYTRLCGWRPESIGTPAGSYQAMEVGSEVGGGVVESSTARPLWLPYVEVADIGAATGAARELGASVLLNAREGPAGWRSVIATPAAGQVALWQSKR